MVFTLRYILGICLVLLTCTRIQPASVLARSGSEVSESQVPSYDTQPVTISQFLSEKIEASTVSDEESKDPKTESSASTASSTVNTTLENVSSHDGSESTAAIKNDANNQYTQTDTIIAVTTSSDPVNPQVTTTTISSNTQEGVKTDSVFADTIQVTNNPIGSARSSERELPSISEHQGTTDNPNTTDSNQQGRTDKGRSLDFDISKYTSAEFHNKNNVYNLPTSPENEKFIAPDFDHKSTTFKTSEREQFTYIPDITTPSSAYFDAKYDEVENKVKQELEDVGHYFDDHTPSSDKQTVDLDELIEKSKRNNSNSRLDFLRYTNIASESKEGKNSVNHNYETENRLKINFDSIYNETKKIPDEEDITTKATDFAPKTSEKNVFTTTTRRNLPTKFSLVNRTNEQSSLLSNKIETETIKPVDLNAREVKAARDEKISIDPIEEVNSFKKTPDNLINVTKRGSTKYIESPTTISDSKENNYEENPKINKIDALLSYKVNNTDERKEHKNETKEQNVEENNIYPVLVPVPQPTTSKSELTSLKLYEMTEEYTSDEESVIDTSTLTDSKEVTTSRTEESSITDKSNTSNDGTTTEETYYEMTAESTTATTDASEEITTESPSINDYTATVDAVTTEYTTDAITTEEPHTTDGITPEEPHTTDGITSKHSHTTDAITSIQPHTIEEVTVTTTESQSGEIQNTTTFEAIVNDSTYPEVATTIDSTTYEPTTEAQSEEPMSYEPRPNKTKDEIATVTQVAIKIENVTVNISQNTTDINLGHPDIDEDNDDFVDEEYIDFQNRKINQTQVGHDDVDVNSEDTDPLRRTTTSKPVAPPDVTVRVTTVYAEYQTVENEDETPTEASNLGSPDEESGDGTVIAIVLSSVGALCLVLLAGLLLFMRRRQKRFNYGQRCTPVSLDAYSMDNVSGYNSVRRKTTARDSKRSYGNPAFNDTSVSHPLNFQALVKFASNTEEISSEFGEIPLVTARTTELPDGCDVKNRYANIIPLPETRVILTSLEDDPTSDYINANYVTGPKGVRGYYIACQAPMLNTVNDFWRMIWEQQSKVILMLTHLYENGVEKCIDYLPPSEVLDCHRLFGDYQVTLKQREVKDKYIISSLQLKNMVTNSWREVTHFWYSGWPEKGVPNEDNSLIAFLIEARSHVKLVQNNTEIKVNKMSNGLANGDVSPIIVHCSPGTGRTGTVIACDIAIREFELKRIVDIPKIVYRIRRDRASSVQTKDQYAFIYKVINLYSTKLTGGALDSI